MNATGGLEACLFAGNILSESSGIERSFSSAAPRILSWSGSLGDGLFEPTPRNWMMPGREALRGVLDRILPGLEHAGKRLILRPHRHQVLSDLQTCAGLFRERAGGPIGLALDPAAMLAASMLATIEDHLQRMFEILGPMCEMVVIQDSVAIEDDLASVPLGSGLMPGRHVSALIECHVPPGIPVVVTTPDIPLAAAWFAHSPGD